MLKHYDVSLKLNSMSFLGTHILRYMLQTIQV